MVHELFYSPVRPLRQPRISENGARSPDENCPSVSANSSDPSANFPRQFMASPAKLNDRNVLFFIGSKIPSSVPGRRSSLGSLSDKKAHPPTIVTSDLPSEAPIKNETIDPQPTARMRSKSLKSIAESSGTSSGTGRTLKRL